MACDGDIAQEEINLIKDYVKTSSLFENLEIEKLLNEYVVSINAAGISFLNSYIKELNNENLSTEQELQIVKIAIAMIEADNEILYSEVKFFKRIRQCLSISDEDILAVLPDKEDYLLPDITQQEYEFVCDVKFNAIKFDIEK